MRHGPGLFDHASLRVQDPPLPGRLARPRIIVPRDCPGEGLSAVVVSGAGDSGQFSEELLDSFTIHRLSMDEDSDYSFEGFPDSQTSSEVVIPCSGIPLLSPPPSVSLASASTGDVLGVVTSSRCQAPYAISLASTECHRLSPGGHRSRLLGRCLPVGSSVVVRRLPSSGRSSTGFSSTRSLPLHGRVRLGLGHIARRRPPLRIVVLDLLCIFDQPPGTAGGSLCGSGFSPASGGLFFGSLRRQHHGVGLPKVARGTHSQTLNSIAQVILRLCESHRVHFLPQFITGRLNVPADSLRRKSQVLGSEWTLCHQAFQELRRRWPATVDLFATSLHHQLQSTSLQWWIISQRGRMRCSSLGTGFRLMPFRPLGFWLAFSPSFASRTAWSSPLWLRFGLNILDSRTYWSF